MTETFECFSCEVELPAAAFIPGQLRDRDRLIWLECRKCMIARLRRVFG